MLSLTPLLSNFLGRLLQCNLHFFDHLMVLIFIVLVGLFFVLLPLLFCKSLWLGREGLSDEEGVRHYQSQS